MHAARISVAGRAAQRRAALFCGRGNLARANLPGRHLRSPRRRVLTLLGRRALAGAAFREDALRQCAAARTAGAGAWPLRQSAVQDPRPGNRRLARARDDDRGRRVLRLARRRFRRRGGQVLRLVARRDRARPRPGRGGILRPALRRHRRGEFRGPHHPQPAGARSRDRRGGDTARRRCAGGCWRSATNACAPGSTTRCWPTGTA